MELISTEMNDSGTGKEHWYWDAVTEKMVIKTTFDVSDVIASNKKRQNQTIDKRFGNEMMHHVAEIPNSLITVFKAKHNLDVFSDDPTDKIRLRRLLESPDYRYLKTTLSKLWRPT